MVPLMITHKLSMGYTGPFTTVAYCVEIGINNIIETRTTFVTTNHDSR